MKNYMLEAFVDELGDIVKQADVMKDVGNPVTVSEPSLMDKAKGALGMTAIGLGLGAAQDIFTGRSGEIGKDMVDLGSRIKKPSRLFENFGQSSKNYFLGASPPKGSGIMAHAPRAVPFLVNALPAAFEAKGLLSKEDQTGQGRSRAARAAELAGRVGGGIIGSRMGGLASAITGTAGQALGSGIGAGIDRVTGWGKKPNRG